MSSEARSQAEPARTVKLPDRYRVRRHIASGGMASVWCAEDLVLGRTVAVKVLAQRFAHDEIAVLRFKREARAAARVSAHPHVVTIFDVGDLEPDADAHGEVARAFIVMEHLAGGTVADALRVRAVNRQEALRWLREAASALDHAHERGIVHRDIKPANFLLDRSRVLHVADFGIARLVSEDTITSSGELFGTAAYLAPEQALGRDATSASDRYALAVAAFELLAGERPFTAPHFAAQARQHLDDEPPSASERNRSLPPAVDAVLIRGMAKQPDARYDTAGELVGTLEAALAGGSTAVTRAPTRARHTTGAEPRRPAATNRETVTPARRAPTTNRSRPVPVTPQRPVTLPRRRGGRVFALAALLIAALGVGFVALGGLSGSHKPASASKRLASGHAASTGHRPRPAKTTVAAPAAGSTTSSATTTSTVTSTAPSTAAQLQQTGHQQLLAGSYPAAIATLRQAVSAAPTTSLTYAYALYDLGRSLMLGGDPAAAVPILEQRLKIPNQTATVREALDQALRASGQAPTPPTTATATTPATTPAPVDPGRSGTTPGVSGGAGLAPGDGHHHGHSSGR